MPAEQVDVGLYDGTAGPPPVRNAGGLRATFHLEPVQDEAETAKQGRPIYRDVEFCQIRILGDKSNIIDRIATVQDKQRFPQEYALFRSGDTEQLVGTPLKEWPGVTKGKIKELAHFDIKTVEQLAEVSDGGLAQMGPFRALRDAAKDWVAAAKKQAPTTQLRAEMKDMAKENAAMKEEIAELRALLNKATDPAPKPAPKAA